MANIAKTVSHVCAIRSILFNDGTMSRMKCIQPLPPTWTDSSFVRSPITTVSESPMLGDYVLATKYSDGDPGDHYAVGFLRQIDQRYGDIRYVVVDGDEKPFRANGFRRCETITDAEGRWLVEHFGDFKPFEHGEDEFGNDVQVGWSVWEWLAYRRSSDNSEAPQS